MQAKKWWKMYLKKLATKFRQDSPLTTSRGKVLDYLGMKIDYCKEER